MNAAGTAAPERDRIGREAPDSELVAAVRAGDDAAFAELYRRHQPIVSRFVRGRVRDHGRAEDVVQEAFVSALRRMRQTDSELAFRAWIFEIARNAAIDLYRRSSRTEEVSMDAVGDLAPADARRVDGSSGPDASLLLKESFEHFRGALDELSETHHRIIVLRELEGRSYREIGERMQLSQAAVESTLFRARRKLAHEYEQLDSGHRCRLVGAAIGRLAEGMESQRDRLRLDRHARRCSACRRQARQLGVEPLLGKRCRGIAARAAAFLPLPGFMRRRSTASGSGEAVAGSGLGPGVGHLGAAFGPSIEVAGAALGKAVAVIAAVVAVGSGGATLGGAGPFALGGQGALPEQLDPDSVDQAAPRLGPEERPDPDPRTTPGAPAAGPDGAAGRPAKNDAGRGGPAALRTPGSPPSADLPGAPSAGLPAVGDPLDGGSDAPPSGGAMPATGSLPAPAPAPALPPSIELGAGAPALTAPASAPDPAGVVRASLGSAKAL
ncbi:hypothetical protein BH20ACT20_BH20ACT20_09570 [soil metagenome]